jgi:hypothetical protein
MLIYPREHTNLEVPLPDNNLRGGGNGRRYGELMQAVKDAAGDWVAVVDLSLVAGRDVQKKTGALHSAATLRGMKIRTTVQHGFVYLRLIGPIAKAVV